MKYTIGCSGYSYKEWKGSFYPEELPQREWFNFYCQHFGMLELNSTFYNFSKLKNLQNWFKKSPENFSFIVKAPRGITHYRKLKDCTEMIGQFYEVCETGLQNKLSALLFQMPPSYDFTEENLERILTSVHAGFRNVFELRNKSWWNDSVYKDFEENNVTFCSVSFLNLPNNVVATSDTVYYRFHGVPELYYSSYTDTELKNIADQVNTHTQLKEIICAFNNTANENAIHNAKWIRDYMEKNE